LNLVSETTASDGEGVVDGGLPGEPTLKRALGPVALTSIGVSSVVGAGIFVLSGVTTAQNTGPAITLSYTIAAIGVLIVALCYSELAAMMPVAGSSYTYVRESMGPLPAWVIGWAMLLEYLVTASTVAVGWSGNLVGMLGQMGVTLPDSLTQAPWSVSEALEGGVTGAYGNLPAALATLALTVLLSIGVKETARFNNFLVLCKISVLVAVVAVGVFYVNPDLWHPFIPENNGQWGHFGWSGVLRGAGLAVWTYTGFETISTCAQETKNPKRDLAVGMIATMAVCTVLYLAFSLVMTGLVPYPELNVSDPVLVAVDRIGPQWHWLAQLVSVGIMIGVSGTLLFTLYPQIRVFYIMAVDKQMPRSFAKVHPKFRTPYVATWFTGIVCAIVAFLTPLDILSELVSMGTMLAFSSVCASVILFRHQQPHRERPFRVPFSPVLPGIGVIFCLGLMLNMAPRSWVFLAGWLAIGAVVFLVSRWWKKREQAQAAG
jgi:APA family basic amino acid/polyamine antiporter